VVLLSSFQRPRTLAPPDSALPTASTLPSLPCCPALPCSLLAPPCRRPTAFRAARLPGASPLLRVSGGALPTAPANSASSSFVQTCAAAVPCCFFLPRSGHATASARRSCAACGGGSLSKLDQGCQLPDCSRGRTSRQTR
jgi:hypothetical protein